MGFDSLRQRLRVETAAEHTALEARCEAMIGAGPDGLRDFVALHQRAFAEFADTSDPLISRPILTDLAARAADDLAAPPPKRQGAGTFQPLAIDYVLCGSMHGMAVLRNHHAAQIARQQLSFFAAPDYRPLWARFRETANRIDPTSELANGIVRDACRVFALYAGLAEDIHGQQARSTQKVPA